MSRSTGPDNGDLSWIPSRTQKKHACISNNYTHSKKERQYVICAYVSHHATLSVHIISMEYCFKIGENPYLFPEIPSFSLDFKNKKLHYTQGSNPYHHNRTRVQCCITQLLQVLSPVPRTLCTTFYTAFRVFCSSRQCVCFLRPHLPPESVSA